ncbi:MAG TPA: diaminopimelate epimerase, partial [Dongiaceae bacterium]|nr:diaminopimelate epimerase [Dongiaceae bacterium]
MAALPFLKMHGLGNDFVVIDLRDRPVALTLPQRRWIADRRRGIGCDQLILLEPPRQRVADVFMRIHNPDGGEAGACGNATRCIAAKVMAEKATRHVIVETVSGLLDAEAAEGGRIAVDMGPVLLDWREIPVSEACDTLHLPVSLGPLADPVGVNVGNPHAVFFVPDAEKVDLASLGPVLERHRLFPERANIEVAHVVSPRLDSGGRIRMRVWERAAGITQACGSGACATLVAAARRKLTGRSATVVLDGGELLIEWLPDNHVRMTGDWAESF